MYMRSCSTYSVASFVQRDIYEPIHVVMCISSWFCLFVCFTESSIPLYGYAIICLSVHLVKGKFLEFTVMASLDTGKVVLNEVHVWPIQCDLYTAMQPWVVGGGWGWGVGGSAPWAGKLDFTPASLNQKSLGNKALAKQLVHFVISSKACIFLEGAPAIFFGCALS